MSGLYVILGKYLFFFFKIFIKDIFINRLVHHDPIRLDRLDVW